MEAKTAQLRVMQRSVIAEGAGRSGRRCPVNCGRDRCSHGGAIFWATPTRARLLLDSGAVELLNAGPAEQPVAGPSETKPTGPLEKKSSAADPDGPSTDSQLSSEPGPAASSSVSAADPASPLTNAQPLAKPRRARSRGKRG